MKILRLKDLEMPGLTAKLRARARDYHDRKHPHEDQLAERPQRLSEFIGQQDAVAQLSLMTQAARERGEPVDHLLMTGPGGLGKTTLALMMATEMEAPAYSTTAPTLGPETIGKYLSTMKPFTVVFIDEFHRISQQVAELLYGAMEDGWIDVPSPVGPERRKVQPFTLVGATTLPGNLSESMRDRFGHVVELSYYDQESMHLIAERSAERLGLKVEADGLMDVAQRSRGVPRVLNAFLARIRDWAQVNRLECLTMDDTDAAFAVFGIDGLGLTGRDQEYMVTLVADFKGGPVGEENLAIKLGMDGRTIRTDIEPYLMRLGLVKRANRGRVATETGRQYARHIIGE